MTIFVERLLARFNSNVVEQIHCHDWLPLVAVVSSLNNGQISVFRDGQPMPGGPWTCPSKPMSLAWHPKTADLVVGLKSGQLHRLSWSSKSLQLPAGRESPVLFLAFPCETQLASVDSMGVVSVWNLTKTGFFQPMTEHSLKDIPTQLLCHGSVSPWYCYVACASGTVYRVVQDTSTVAEVAHLEDSAQKMLGQGDHLCVLTTSATIAVFADRNADAETLQTVNTVKMSGKSRAIQLAWLSPAVLAIAGGDLVVRLWNYASNETWTLPIPQDSFHSGAEQFTSMAFGRRQQQLLATATNLGNVCFWRQQQPKSDPTVAGAADDEWQFIGLIGLSGGPIVQSVFTSQAVCVHNGTAVYLISEQQPRVAYRNQTSAVQVSSSVLNVQKGRNTWPIDVPFVIADVDLYASHLLVRGQNHISVYQLNISNEKPVLKGHFECVSSCAKLHKSSCFSLEAALIQMRSLQGTVLTTLSTTDSEGTASSIHSSGNFLCAATSTGFVKLWDISNREPRLHVNSKHVTGSVRGFAGFRQVKCNVNGSCVAFTVNAEGHAWNRLLNWRTASNTVAEFDFGADWNVADFFWDEEEPRVVLCQLSAVGVGTEGGSRLVSLLVSEDPLQDLLVQDQVDVAAGAGPLTLVGFRIPKYLMLDQSSKVHVRRLESLVPLDEHGDKATRDALLSFGVHLRRGQVEQAYQVVRSLTSAAVWKNLARSCVRLRRPDVGLICLGKLGDARAAQTLRSAQRKYPLSVEAQTAVLAVQLAMNDEAEQLLLDIGCYELLGKMYQASNQWDKALKLAQTKDRLNLKRICYEYARHLEAEGKFQPAKEMYEKCQTHHFDVPRMLYEDSAALKEYCTSSNDTELVRWWAQFLESSGELDAALETYNKAGDYLSMVRLHCYMGNMARAKELAEQSHNPAACFHVARQLESDDQVAEALQFFAQAGAYGNAVRLCKEHALDDQLYRYALQGDQEELIEAARYFESPPPADGERPPRFDRAVLLYSKAGLLDTALDLASRTDQHEAVLELSRRLDSNSNPASLQRCAHYLAGHEHYDAAVSLLAMAGKVSEAIEMCLQFNVKLTESLADRLSADTGHNVQLSVQLAEAAQRQGDYQLAAKKFTQAGEKLLAMKALLKSGDTERIVFFANVSRQKEIYVLAGNYLQTLDWRAHPEYVKSIVSYYTRAKTPQLLAAFYESCAQAEIDDYQNYESAVRALEEALRTLERSNDSQTSLKKSQLQRKVLFLQQLTAKIQSAGQDLVQRGQLEELLHSADLAELDLVRPGHIYAALFDVLVRQDALDEALDVLQRMKTAGIRNVSAYLDRVQVEAVCRAKNVAVDDYLRTLDDDDDDDAPADHEEIKEIIRAKN